MATYTSRLNATKPASSENVAITTLNNNADLFDAGVGATVGVFASRPASAFNGRLYWDTTNTKLYVNTGTSASTVASWQDPVAGALTGNVTIGGSLTVANGVTITAGKGYKTYVKKSSATGRASTTTIASDPHLTFPIAASAVYYMESHLYVSGSAAADVKFAWSGIPATTERATRGPATSTTDNTAASTRHRWHNWSTEVAYGLDANDAYITETGLIDNSAGGSATVVLQWAQNASVAVSTVMNANAFLVVERLT